MLDSTAPLSTWGKLTSLLHCVCWEHCATDSTAPLSIRGQLTSLLHCVCWKHSVNDSTAPLSIWGQLTSRLHCVCWEHSATDSTALLSISEGSWHYCSTLIQPAAKERNGMWEANVMLYIPSIITGHCLKKIVATKARCGKHPKGTHR